MVNGAFFCATLRSFRKGHTTFVQAGAETSRPVRGWLSRSQAFLGRAILGEWVPISVMEVRIFVLAFQLLCFPSVIGQERRTYVVVVR